MTRVDKTMLLAVLAGAAIAAVSASCANSCSGHGSCGTHDRCSCYAMWTGTDCSKKDCPSGPSFTSDGYEVCSGRGVCDAASGTCACSEGYTGYNCGRTSCPNDCSGHGKCTSAGVDGGMTRACVCDGYYSGADCSFRQCPRGDDPLTTEIECQGVASGAQSHEVQEITLTADKQLSGEMTLTYTDAYGQAWTTMPIAVGGDLEYDLRISAGTGGCSLKYMSATLTSDQNRNSGDDSTTDSDFGATEFGVPGVLAGAMTTSDCDELSAAAMEALLEQNGAVKNVKVTKYGDANTGTARFHVSIGDVNFQNENDGMEVGVFSMTGRAADSDFHSVGDRSQAIKDALQALPYNVVPSVDVSRVKVDGGSDYADSTVVYGNMVQQKYRITFSDAANAGDQVSLQCNAEGCNADGCAPRYKGVTHKRYISTKYGSDPMDTTGGVTDYRTAIVATGQGSWWLRSHSLDTRSFSEFTSGTYFVHWDLGNGKVSSTSFAYNADQAAIQTALRSIEGWSGVSVSCYGTPGRAGRDMSAGASGITAAVAEAAYGLECKVTYAKGFDDGGKLPTMTYDNIHQGMDAQDDGALVNGAIHTSKTHRTPLGSVPDIGFSCVNEMCAIKNIGYVDGTQGDPNDGDYTSFALFTGSHDSRGNTADAREGKADNWIGYVYIRNADGDGAFPSGTYEIVRVGSSSKLNAESMSDLIIYAPGVADMGKAAAFGATSGKNVYLYKATPLMPMWPSFSNSIALHDSSFRMIMQPDATKKTPLHLSGTGAGGGGQDYWGHATNAAHASAKMIANIHYGPYGATTGASADLTFHPNLACSEVLSRLSNFAAAGPYPSLNGICDCKRTTMEVAPFEVEYTLTCPGWLGYLLNNDAIIITTSAHHVQPQVTSAEKMNIFAHHRRLAPERSLEQLVAVGDTVTVTASGANTNKQFKVKSFAYDNMWGDGGKGSAIWSAKAGYLGGDNAAGFLGGSVVSLSADVDYRSYGDFVPFLKVDPAPSDDYGITEMYTEGTNGTHFERTLEDISTTLAETATLKVYDMPSVEGALTGNVKSDCSKLSGTFQLIYDGELSPVIPVTSSANQVMQYLSEMTKLAHVPVVEKSADGTAVGDTTEAVAAGTGHVAWSFTFDPRLGDAKKLTFKYTDAVGDEQKTSAIKGSVGGDSYLVNEIKKLAQVGAGTMEDTRYVSNKIVMTYTSGSTFYDKIDLDHDGASGLIDVNTADDFFQDELAMDVVPGTTMKVSSAEVHHMYLYETANEATTTSGDTTALDAGCVAASPSTNPHVVLEYKGMFSKPASLCSGTDKKWQVVSSIAGSLKGNVCDDPADGVATCATANFDEATCLAHNAACEFTADPAWSELVGLSLDFGVQAETITTSGDVVVEGTAIQTLFNSRFPWAATHSGNPRVRLSFTFPMGIDGDSVKLHFQRGAHKAAGIGRYYESLTNVNDEFKVFTHRERNNNGRTFTVTKAYENKVSDLLSVSRVGAFVAADGGGLAGVITHPSVATAWTVATACGDDVRGLMTPGTYYNVRTHIEAPGGTRSSSGAGAILMVVVDGDGDIAEVQITSGGQSTYKTGETIYFADTRLHASMLRGADATRCAIVIGDMTTSAKSNMLLKSISSGIHSGMSCAALTTGNTCTGDDACTGLATKTFSTCSDAAVFGGNCVFTSVCGEMGATALADSADAVVFHHVPNNQDADADGEVFGVRHTIQCDKSLDVVRVTVTAGGSTDNNDLTGTRDTKNAGDTTKLLAGVGTLAGGLKLQPLEDCMNDLYYQFGFYSTGTPRFERDLVQNGHDMGVVPKDQQVSLYGMKNHMQYQFSAGTANMATDSFYGEARDTFSDLNGGMGTFGGGYSITETNNDGEMKMTASVIAGHNGQGSFDHSKAAGEAGHYAETTHAEATSAMMEHAEKYAYIGKGYDKLTVTPMPDAMSAQKVTITYTGPSAGCSVTEVDRGTHESSECSGRGNCDYSTGTCLCDAGYTLEACSEQTVLV